jgi:hypothetical protein
MALGAASEESIARICAVDRWYLGQCGGGKPGIISLGISYPQIVVWPIFAFSVPIST